MPSAALILRSSALPRLLRCGGVFGAPATGFNRVISGFGWAEAPRLNCSHPNPNVNTQNEESFST